MKLLIFHNIATAYYKNIVFNELYKYYKDFKVVHIAETQKQRDWNIDLSYLKYPYEVLFRGNIDDVKKTSLIKKIIGTIKKENPRIIYLGGYSELAYWIALMYGKLKKKKIIIEMDTNEYVLGKKIWYKEILKKIFVKFCNNGITYSHLSKKYLISLGMEENKTVLKPNVTENEWWISKSIYYRKRRSEIIKKYGFKKNNFIFVGRFSREKNLFFMLKAFKELKKEKHSKDWGIIMVGSGYLEKKLKDYIKKMKIEDVYFVGFKQKEELPEYYAGGDVLILPSLSEPWGIVVNEAMASGIVPAISNRCGAIDLIENGVNGFIFDPLNKKELTDLMVRIIENKININQIKSEAEKSIKKYSAEFAAKKIIELVNLVNSC